MHLPFFIAKRYLFAKKSHNVINIISLISAIGIMIGTTALIVVLSIYNGFNDLVTKMYSKFEADLVIEPARGKFFSVSGENFDFIRNNPNVISFYEIVQENVFVTYSKTDGIALIKGVDSLYEQKKSLKQSLLEGEFDLRKGDIPQAVVGRGIAKEMGIRPHFIDPLDVYFPAKGKTISTLNPMSSLNKESLFPAGIIAIEKTLDNSVIFLPIDISRRLLGLDDEVSIVEISLREGADVPALKASFSEALGDEYIFKDRYQQNETIYKMMTYEKVVIYMILMFIIIIISCNVFGSLSMLIIEKRGDIITLKRIGATSSFIKKVFVFEGWLISLFGILIGVGFGIGLCLIQLQFGLIKMPGNFIISAYPIIIEPLDVLLTILGVALIGLVVSILPTWKTIPNIYNEIENE